MGYQHAYPNAGAAAYSADGIKQKISWNRALAYICVIMVLCFSTHAFQFLFADGIEDGLAAKPTARNNPAYLLNFGIQLSLFGILTISHIISNGIKLPFITAVSYCSFVLGSVFWSVSPGTTMVPAILFSYLVMAAYVTSAMFTPRQFLRVFFYLGVVIFICSFYLLISGSPHAGVDRWGGGWFLDIEFTGVMASKNFAGIVFATLTILAINAHHLGVNPKARWFVLLVGPIAIVLSNSATALLIFIFLSIPAMMLSPKIKAWPPVLFFMVLFFACLMPVFPFVSGLDLSAIGRDATFTGRSFLWEVAFERFPDYPFIGHGYYAFYDTDPYSPVWGLWERFRYWHADNFHNSFMDIVVSLGLVGVALMIGSVMWAGTVLGNQSIDPASRICLGLILCGFCIGSYMEFAVFHHNYIATFMLFYILFSSMWEYKQD